MACPRSETAGQVLTVNAGVTAAEWADSAGGTRRRWLRIRRSAISLRLSVGRCEGNSGIANYDDNETVNVGGFTTRDIGSVTDGGIIRLPGAGVYFCRFVYTGVVETIPDNDDRFWGRARIWTETNNGKPMWRTTGVR